MGGLILGKYQGFYRERDFFVIMEDEIIFFIIEGLSDQQGYLIYFET